MGAFFMEHRGFEPLTCCVRFRVGQQDYPIIISNSKGARDSVSKLSVLCKLYL